MLFVRGNYYLPHYLALQAEAAGGDRGAVAQLAQHAAFVGDEAAATANLRSPGGIPDSLTLTGEPAIAAILERARGRRIVILNEAHSISGHGAFANRLLRALRPEGFNVFAAETFNWTREDGGPAVQDLTAGEAFLPAHGYYSRDPVYAEAAREALALGYRLAGYEQTNRQRLLPADADSFDRINERDEAEARNFVDNILKADPDARVFVLCGYSHVTESPMEKMEWFASRLKRLSGEDPLTIEQSFNWPAFDPSNDPPATRAVLERLAPSESIAVFEPSGRPFTTEPYSDRVDLSVFHPRVERVADRPGWLAADPTRKATPVTFPASGGPALLQAVRVAEGMGSIPSDQMLVTPDQTTATLFLKPAEYLIRIETPEGWRMVGGMSVAS